jgi:hypothetical protein
MYIMYKIWSDLMLQPYDLVTRPRVSTKIIKEFI